MSNNRYTRMTDAASVNGDLPRASGWQRYCCCLFSKSAPAEPSIPRSRRTMLASGQSRHRTMGSASQDRPNRVGP